MNKKIKLNYAVIPAITIAVFLLGGISTNSGMEWYKSLILPDFTPPGYVISMVWFVIYILTAVSALLLANNKKMEKKQRIILLSVFSANVFLNFLWSFIFFGLNLILISILEMVILNATTLFLIAMSFRYSKIASVLLLPYFVWVSFATYLAWQILILN